MNILAVQFIMFHNELYCQYIHLDLNILAVQFIMEHNIKINIATLPQPNFPEALTIGDGMLWQ